MSTTERPSHRPETRTSDKRPRQGSGFDFCGRARVLTGSERSSVRWLYGFILFQIACQLFLAFGPVGTGRVVVRGAAFGSSLLMMSLLWAGRRSAYPARPAATWILAIIGLSSLHPTTNTLASAGAQAVLYAAVLAPLYWIPSLSLNLAAFRRSIWLLWGFHILSAAVGVLQVYFPDLLQPNVSTVFTGGEADSLAGLTIVTAKGELVLRPMGLSDAPGAAAMSGFYAVVLGSGFLLTARRWRSIALYVTAMTVGMACIYLSYVRAVVVLVGICLVALGAALAWRRELRRLLVVAGLATFVALTGGTLAVAIGGEGVIDRLATLVEGPATEVYYQNRGHFLEHTLAELLPSYPLGAGPGRWGMAFAYFGRDSVGESGPIWVEVQWTGWLLDGGLPLVVAYVCALILALWTMWRMVSHDVREVALWAAVLLAYNVGAIAMTFSYPFFIGQSGMEFWMLNVALFQAAQERRVVAGSRWISFR